MKPTLDEKFIAYLALISGLSISAVAVYYSVIGLTAIFAAAAVPIIIMGVVLEVSKLVATVWLKQNWTTAPGLIRSYLIAAVIILMFITSMGIFGFLSKAHLDQSVPAGEVIDKIAIYDEKIRISRENIDANRRALKQLDEAVDQVMGRSTSESGAERSVQIRRQQGPERQRLIREIETEQKKISELNEARAPIASEVRKVEAEVGPIKYIAAFFYGETDKIVLEKAVTWVIIIIVIVFDPLAVVLLLAAQTSFQNFRQRESSAIPLDTDLQKDDTKEEPIVEQVKVATTDIPLYLKKKFKYPEGWTFKPVVGKVVEENVKKPPVPIRDLPGTTIVRTKVFPRPKVPENYVQNEEQQESNLWSSTKEQSISSDEYIKAVNARREAEIKSFAELVRSRQIQMQDVPEEYQQTVKSMV